MSLCTLEVLMSFKQAADICYLHARAIESMLAGDSLPVMSIAMSKFPKSRG